ncbi:16859_t:CDS:2 [Cetraspora pellucida]|uniref:16859_t:CDS:1 n=1 Tax=Cetraspora pellucida TaxID=1433469 RepID=A0A9N9FIB5_9GLOM|nr:16859_t:CDS:2 [Cetraspora pellucida]
MKGLSCYITLQEIRFSEGRILRIEGWFGTSKLSLSSQKFLKT